MNKDMFAVHGCWRDAGQLRKVSHMLEHEASSCILVFEMLL